ncbi:ATP-binding protein [Sedimenticola hydrogenitrophicus]|uniref:ATP-binding protein n=1 Tax=Sedimenticola hydrogenitrophicus TaxID=2967975 RepID=UPI0021A8FCA4|nr:ATP-binding protein [Sedimenticola hydrogenitrophicus]
MLSRPHLPTFRNPEFQSALVRLAIWLFAVVYIGLGAASDYYAIDLGDYSLLFGGFLLLFLLLLVSIFYRAEWEARRYLSLLLDVSATSLCIYLTKEVVSPFYLLYIWIFISYGTRYGKRHLKAASLLSILAYTLLLTVLGQWEKYTFEVIFFLLLLILLPLYQYSLLRKLHAARLEAEQSDRAKGIFLSSMTHELRTPLSGIVGMSQLLGNTTLNLEQREYLDSIASSANILDSLISEVLDLSKMDAEGFVLKPKLFDIRGLLRDISLTHSHQALDKGLELICRVDEAVPAQLYYDELRLRQILCNLLSNALKFTESGEIELSATLADDREEGHQRLVIAVRDTGIGIPQEQQQKLFERFWQADASSTRGHGGLGLGTTITKRLIQLMDGEVTLESSPGTGSTFRVQLPLAGQTLAPATDRTCRFDGFSALIYERNRSSLEIIRRSCAARGIHCHGVSNIGELSELIQRAERGGGLNFAIIADSPGGQDVYRIGRILRQHLGSELIVIYLGYMERKLSDNHPASHFLIKPFISSELLNHVGRLLRRGGCPEQGGQRVSSPPLELPINVLMAEDNEINARVLSTLLAGIGCRVSWARNGEEALALALRQRFDIAFVDLRMPKMDGILFTREYRGQEQGDRRLPIIALTANATSNIRKSCAEAGMDDFLAKPVDESLLRQAIERYTTIGGPKDYRS